MLIANKNSLLTSRPSMNISWAMKVNSEISSSMKLLRLSSSPIESMAMLLPVSRTYSSDVRNTAGSIPLII